MAGIIAHNHQIDSKSLRESLGLRLGEAGRDGLIALHLQIHLSLHAGHQAGFISRGSDQKKMKRDKRNARASDEVAKDVQAARNI